MNYRHFYHAGSFADVVKHIALIALLEKLAQKETPFCFLDTHAGIGLYDLHAEAAQKKCEYKNGVVKLLLAEKNGMPTVVQNYLAIVKKYNARDFRYYPGSPIFARELLRDHDQMILCELHREDVVTLKNNMGKDKQVAIHHLDGYLGLKAFLPPKLKRGMVLIDPPFEKKDEFESIVASVSKILSHWKNAPIMIWYPIKNRKYVQQFYGVVTLLAKSRVIVECTLRSAESENQLSSCGLLLVNPPWKLKETLQNAFGYLQNPLECDFKLK